MICQNLGWDYFELETGHDAMISMPDELAHMLIKAIGYMRVQPMGSGE